MRYNDAVYDVTQDVTGDGILWGRSAWAGSQRYPVHWGGDAENTNEAMAATLRAGLSMGLSGFTYWSHDIGGFVNRAPREPWEYDEELVVDFRRAMDLKYALMPYIYAQAKASSEQGHPMMRALFFDFPDDPTSWLIEDEYLFGSDLLVAPLFEEAHTRKVYLPPGSWIDYQTGIVYEGATWHDITAGDIPIILLVKDGTVLPHIAVAPNTAALDWSTIELRVYGTAASGLFTRPEDGVHTLELEAGPQGFTLTNDPLSGQVNWRIIRVGE